MIYKIKHAAFSLVLLVALAGLAGCISPGPIDPSVIQQYQQHLVEVGPHDRQPDNLVLPEPGSTGPPLRTFVDEETGTKMVRLTLAEAVARALGNSPQVRIVGYDPAVARQDVIEAAAAFDPVVFSSLQYNITEERPRAAGNASRTETMPFEMGIRQPLATGNGAQIEMSYGFTRSEDDSTFANALDPRWDQNLAVALTQPLLRNAGPDVALAQLRITRINHETSLEQFRASVLDLILQTQTLYWQLARARQELVIQETLLARTEETLEQVIARGELDANRVQITQTQAAVESRRAALIQARKNIQDVRDELVRTMADASFTLLDDYEFVLETPPAEAELTVDPADQIATSLKYSPELGQARLAIAGRQIEVTVAENQTLPALDFAASTGVRGSDTTYSDSMSNLWDFDYIQYGLALTFEWPIGNRGPRAALQRSRYNLSRSIVTLQDTADQLAVAVKEAIRAIQSRYLEIQANTKALEASLANLDALEARAEYRQALTPEFLQLRLQAQENVAAADRAVLQALVDFNIAQANLARLTGTSVHNLGVVITDASPGDEAFPNALMSRVRLTGADSAADAAAYDSLPEMEQLYVPSAEQSERTPALKLERQDDGVLIAPDESQLPAPLPESPKTESDMPTIEEPLPQSTPATPSEELLPPVIAPPAPTTEPARDADDDPSHI